MKQRKRKGNNIMRKNDAIKLERLEERLKNLERNVGAIMFELNLAAVVTRESYANYREGYNNPIHMNNSGIPKTNNSEFINSAILVDDEDKETVKRIKDFLRFEK